MAKGLPPCNLIAVPGVVLSRRTAAVGNRCLSMAGLPQPPEGVEREALEFASADGTPVQLALYRPVDPTSASPASRTGELPCLVYFHGGGFCFADAPYIHRIVAEYAQAASCAVAFVRYRTSDVHPFPTPFLDCREGLRFVRDHAAALGLDRARIGVGGDSAGGALAVACALWARDEGGIPLACQLLAYPVLDARMQTTSMRRFVDAPLWNARLNRRMWEIYLRRNDHSAIADADSHTGRHAAVGSPSSATSSQAAGKCSSHAVPEQASAGPSFRASPAEAGERHSPHASSTEANRPLSPYASPAEASRTPSPYASPAEAASVAGLPTAYIEVEEFDCLHDEGVQYARRLQDAGVPVELVENPGTFHGFDFFWKSAPAQKAISRRASFLKQAFERSRQHGV